MAQRTISRLYDNYGDATQAVTALEAAGIPHGDISLLGSNGTAAAGAADTAQDASTYDATAAGTGAGAGATVGTVIGGGAGLLAGLGSLAIPGVGPIVAAGWLIANLTGAGVGATAGGLLGSLTGAGVPEHEAHTYAEGVRRGGSLVTVRVADDTRVAEVESILARYTPVDAATRRSEYQNAGWSGFDEAAGPYGATGAPGTLPGRNQVP